MTASPGVLPQESEAQRIGHMAGRCLSATHPDSWRLKCCGSVYLTGAVLG